MLEAARSQIAGTVAGTEVRTLPLNGRNFLDLALLVPGVSPTNVASTQLFPETSAVPGVSAVGRQPAQPLQQLHRRRAVGQRRRGGAERDHVRRRCGRAVPGRHVRRAGRARTRARRLRQRRDQERHERAARHRLRLLPRRRAQRGERAVRRRRCRWTSRSSAPASAGRSSRTGRSTSPTSSSAGSIRSGLVDDRRRQRRRRSTRGSRPSATRGRWWRPASIRTRSIRPTCSAKVDHQVSGRDQFSVRYSLYDVSVRATRAAPAG